MPTERKILMTDRWLRDLEGPDAPADPDKTATVMWWDSESPLIVKASSRGGKSLMTWYRNQSGVLRWYAIGRFPPWRIADARDVAREVRNRAALGEDPHAAKVEARRKHRVEPSFEQLARRYLAADDVKRRVKSLSQYAARLEADVLPAWGSRKAVDITEDDARALLNGLAERSRGTARLTKAAVSAVFAWAIGAGVVKTKNPLRDLELPVLRKTEDEERTRVYDHDELRRMWAAFGDDDPGRVLKLLLLTGARRGDVTKMTWREVKGRVWTIPASRIKRKRPHEVWLSDEAVRLVGERGEGLVFPGAKKDRLNGRWAEVETATGIEHAHEEGAVIHDLRRTFQTNVAEHIDEPWVADLMTAHVKKGMQRIYDQAKHRARFARNWDEWARIVTQRIAEGRPVEEGDVTQFPGSKKSLGIRTTKAV
jgi:integrase